MVKIEHPKKPMHYYRISDETWEKLSLKEKDYLILINDTQKKYTKSQIMRKLYIESRCWFYLFIGNIKNKISKDVIKLNRLVK